MIAIPSRHRSLVLLTIVVVAQVLMLAIQIQRTNTEGESKNLVRSWSVGLISPFERAGTWTVGKVIDSFSNTEQGLLLTDRESGVGAMIEESRIQSPVRGSGEPLISMSYVSNDDEVKIGEHVVTSGTDRIFPRELPVGTIVEVKQGPPPFKYIRLRPAAQLEKLEEVIVLLTMDPLAMKKPAQTSDAAPASATGNE